MYKWYRYVYKQGLFIIKTAYNMCKWYRKVVSGIGRYASKQSRETCTGGMGDI